MAVYTAVSDEDLQAFVASYDIGEVTSFAGIAEGVENSNFMLRTTTGSYILTLYEKRVERGDLPFFLGLMEHLAAKGVACPTPLHDRQGRALRELNGKPAAMISFLDGMWPRRIQPAHCTGVGIAMAQFHTSGADFAMTRRNGLTLEDWRPLFDKCADRADEVKPGLAAMLRGELDFLEANWPRDLPRGVIHADLFPDNVFFKGQKLSGIIDFYFACTDALAYDIAVCLNAWCFEHDGSFNITKARLMLTAYAKLRRPGEAEIAALPILCRGAALRFLLTRLYDWLNHPPGAFVKPKDPLEYADKLRFHQKAGGPGDYGIDAIATAP
ncbi:MAG: homoserine kinase [Alphaproteobacteria bacterium]|nr:homoserine kinase [Alphaproteobacteria bacterium]MBU0798242.1 homoserine kinase [Alphaproteobacteria bacterium]MBU0888612.1 homoserine kinase [Alphaproteobacteria bacterium]MBU1813654.1 homoserine kinase [Alphaproteobacteria bacterium]MBU2091724.1 homoserine kinase [Alphaproteobacteria bacterium]